MTLDDGKGQDDYYDEGNQGGERSEESEEFHDYSDEYGDDSLEEETIPVLEMSNGRNRKKIQRRLDKYHCKGKI